MAERRKFDRQFKIDAVNVLESSGKTATALAAELGIRRDALSRWKREFKDDTMHAFPGHGNPRDEELYRMKKELADVKMERDILKKLWPFSRNQKTEFPPGW